jgi:hypothetical protein
MPSQLTQTQRFLTTEFTNKKRLNVATIWLKPESASASAEDAIKAPGSLVCNLNEWGDTDRNAGACLIDGYVELKITSPDDVWFRHFAPLVDARAAFGLNRKPVSSVILKIEDPTTIDRWENLWPKGHTDKGGRFVSTKFVYSLEPTIRSKAIWRYSSPLPGSRFAEDLVVWRPKGKPATDDSELGLEDLEARPIHTVQMADIVRAIAFATLGYWIEIYLEGLTEWDEMLTRILGGWIARLVREGTAINARGKSLEGACWSPIDSVTTASDLFTFLEKMGAKKDLGVAFLHAETALERDPLAPVPGWPSIERLFGIHAKIGIRRAFRAGIDIDAIERMSERYVYDKGTQEYLDRERLLQDLSPYEHKHDHLIERYATEAIIIGKKAHNPFKLYAASSLRTDVDHREFRPGHEPGAILRSSRVYGLLNADAEPCDDEYRLFNTFSGFSIKPSAVVDQTLMIEVVGMLNQVLGLLTQNNPNQMRWLQQFIAWIVQHPEKKPQVCPVIIGGQGIGKSFFGGDLMDALFGRMAGTADAASLTDNKFLITPFIGKLITFIDEVRLESIGAINIIKRLVRSHSVSGQMKFGHQKDWYIPSRILIASNSPDIGLTPADAADRAFFFIMSYTAENMQKSDLEFLNWANELKPFYAKFTEMLKLVPVRQHLMRHFMDFETTQIELENLQYSSRNDENVVRSVMSAPRAVGRKIVADARVLQGADITAWFNMAALREAIKRHEGPRTKIEPHQVREDWERCGVIEKQRGDWFKFKFKYGTLLERLGTAHGLELHNDWEYVPDDYGDNDIVSTQGAPNWRGNTQKGSSRGQPRSSYNPDYMEPE